MKNILKITKIQRLISFHKISIKAIVLLQKTYIFITNLNAQIRGQTSLRIIQQSLHQPTLTKKGTNSCTAPTALPIGYKFPSSCLYIN